MRVNGEVVRGCLMLAVQCDGASVETIEGVSDTGEIADLQDAFEKRNALQCGYCTPGMLLTAQELLASGTTPSREEIREHISGNYCRCTGYHAIVDAVESVAAARATKSVRTHMSHHHGHNGPLSPSERADALEEEKMHEMERIITKSTIALSDGRTGDV